ncbi:15-hydroxyprostaglandin dehydrogenase [NAD(+)]-like [Pomacea canaliculata]|nr:15-hydroxyprostaglandin dehydrogenase [NAD(+)]-like [Pomacea canaliculata]
MDTRDKGVFLTGGAQGLGRGIVVKLLSLGAKVFFVDVDVERGKATQVELQTQYGADVVFFQPADVSDGEQHKAAFDAAVSTLGAVEICVNNAGIMAEDKWEKVLAVNAGSHIRGSLLALEHMRRDRGGRGGVIINVASLAALYPKSICPSYTASKHAVIGFTTSWAMNPDHKDHGVRWCCLCPATFQSGMVDLKRLGDLDTDTIAEILQKQGFVEISQVVEGVMKLMRDPDNNGAILEVSLEKGARYRRRQVVDRDGVSDLVVVDTY